MIYEATNPYKVNRNANGNRHRYESKQLRGNNRDHYEETGAASKQPLRESNRHEETNGTSNKSRSNVQALCRDDQKRKRTSQDKLKLVWKAKGDWPQKLKVGKVY